MPKQQEIFSNWLMHSKRQSNTMMLEDWVRSNSNRVFSEKRKKKKKLRMDSLKTFHIFIGYTIHPAINVNYAVSKSLVHAYTSVLANEHPEITSTSYCPGPIDTDMNRSSVEISPEIRKLIPVSYPIKEGADTGLFLIQSEKKDLVNGGFYAERKQRSKVNAPFRTD